jgi:hypothetical protein
MSLSMYQASVPVFLHGLDTLTHILRKGEAHASESGADPASYVDARLAPDMLTLAGQIQRASDTSKLAMERIELKLRDFNPVFTGASYLLTFALPNFYFHVTTAYDILRHKGVPLAKLDYLRLKGQPDQHTS